MTEPIERIGSTGVVIAGKSDQQERMRQKQAKSRRRRDAEDDQIDISPEARDCASGKKRKSLLEYLFGEEPEEKND